MASVIVRRRKLGKGSTEAIASHTGMSVVRAGQQGVAIPEQEASDYVFRLGYTGTVATAAKVVNTAAAIVLAGDKAKARTVLKYTPQT